MNIYKLTRPDVVHSEYCSAVVVAIDETEARLIHPIHGYQSLSDPRAWHHRPSPSWPRPCDVIVKKIGKSTMGIETPCLVCASFNVEKFYE